MPAQIVHAPHRPPLQHATTLFLAGTTPVAGEADWRRAVQDAVAGLAVSVLDPVRADWAAAADAWTEDPAFAPFREQVAWELEMQERATLVAFYFDPRKDGPVSLLELGLCARVPGKALVACPPGYHKRGNVQMVCARYGVPLVGSVGELAAAVAAAVAEAAHDVISGA